MHLIWHKQKQWTVCFVMLIRKTQKMLLHARNFMYNFRSIRLPDQTTSIYCCLTVTNQYVWCQCGCHGNNVMGHRSERDKGCTIEYTVYTSILPVQHRDTCVHTITCIQCTTLYHSTTGWTSTGNRTFWMLYFFGSTLKTKCWLLF